jgi:hypothetical protein
MLATSVDNTGNNPDDITFPHGSLPAAASPPPAELDAAVQHVL